MAAPLLVVRHGVAVPRRDWSGDDDLRPLTSEGERQAAGLSRWLAGLEAAALRLLSSAALRCTATLEPHARRVGGAVECCDELRPGRDADAGALAQRLLSGGGGVLCTHGEVVPGLLAALGARLDGPPPEATEKGAVWIVRRPRSEGAASGPVTSGTEARYVGPDKLVGEAGG